MSQNRTHEIAKGIRVAKAPEDMNADELEDALMDVAAYASRILSECITMRSIITRNLKGNK